MRQGGGQGAWHSGICQETDVCLGQQTIGDDRSQANPNVAHQRLGQQACRMHVASALGEKQSDSRWH